MEPEFITYQKFNDIVLAEELADLLDDHRIQYQLEEEPQPFNPTFDYGNTREYTVKMQVVALMI